MVLALMICQKHGVPQSACMMVATALLTAKYSVKTGFGISEGTYFHNQLMDPDKEVDSHRRYG